MNLFNIFALVYKVLDTRVVQNCRFDKKLTQI